mgnify:CR=1 FL=1
MIGCGNPLSGNMGHSQTNKGNWTCEGRNATCQDAGGKNDEKGRLF